MRFYPMYLTEYEIELLLNMIKELSALKLTDEEKRIKQSLQMTIDKIKEKCNGD